MVPWHSTLATITQNHQNDQALQGHHPRVTVGCSVDQALDLVCQLWNYMTSASLLPLLGCIKRSRQHAWCPVCLPLFPISLSGRSSTNTMPY